MAALVFTDSKFSGQRYELMVEKTTVGRGDDNILVIRDPSLSAHHCEILYNHPEVIVRDLGSRNGTVVGGVKLQNQQSQLKGGDTLRLGSVEARLDLPRQEGVDEDTSETAVYFHKKIMRDQRRAKDAAPADPARTLGEKQDSPDEERTILMPRSKTGNSPYNPAPLPSSSGPAVPSISAKRRAAAFLAIVGAIAVSFIAWWLRSRH